MTDTIEQLVVRWTDAEEIRLRAGEIDTETMRTVLAVTRAFAAQVLEWNDDRILNKDVGGSQSDDSVTAALVRDYQFFLDKP